MQFGTICSMGILTIHLKNSILWVKGVYDLAYELCYCVDMVVNHILTESGHLVQWHCDCFLGSFKWLWIIITQQKMGTWCSDAAIVYSRIIKRLGIFINQQNMCTWILKWLRIVITQKNMGPWCSDTVFFSGSFKRLRIFPRRNIWNQHVFCV